MTVAVADLFTPTEPGDELETVLAQATALKMPVTSWIEGEPTKVTLRTMSTRFSDYSKKISPALAGALLDFASGDWLTIWAHDFYEVDRITQTFAETPVVFTNTAAVPYTVSAGDITVANASTGKTYRTVEPLEGAVTIPPSGAVTLAVRADLAGSSSSSAPTAINEMVTSLLGVTCSNPAAAVGLDDEEDGALIGRCRLSVKGLSQISQGPDGRYVYVAITPTENGGASVTKATVEGQNIDGSVNVVIAGPSGAVSGGDVTLVDTALRRKVIGPVETLNTISATNRAVAITYSLWLYSDDGRSEDDIKAAVTARLSKLFAVAPIGGWKKAADPNGKIFVNLLESVIRSVTNRAFQVSVTLPAADVDVGSREVPVLGGTPTATIVFEDPPATGGTV